MFYRKANIENQSAILAGLQQGVFVAHDDMNGQSFLRIVKGICSSPQTPRKVKQHIGCDEPVSGAVKPIPVTETEE